MIVCTHGDVDNFCKSRDMVVVGRHLGNIEDYSGVSRILVTDFNFTENEYYEMKAKMLAKGVELVSTRYNDSEVVAHFMIASLDKTRREKSGGRCKFGFQNVDGKVVLTEDGKFVVKRIFQLRDLGYSYHSIRDDEDVRHPDGRKIAVSTIQIIVENRKIYEKEGL